MSRKQAESRPVNAEHNGRLSDLQQGMPKEFNKCRISPVEVFQQENGGCAPGKGCKYLSNSISQSGFPELRAHLFYLGVAEGIETSYVRDNISLVPHQALYP